MLKHLYHSDTELFPLRNVSVKKKVKNTVLEGQDVNVLLQLEIRIVCPKHSEIMKVTTFSQSICNVMFQ